MSYMILIINLDLLMDLSVSLRCLMLN